jgi:hypothetical protein
MPYFNRKKRKSKSRKDFRRRRPKDVMHTLPSTTSYDILCFLTRFCLRHQLRYSFPLDKSEKEFVPGPQNRSLSLPRRRTPSAETDGEIPAQFLGRQARPLGIGPVVRRHEKNDLAPFLIGSPRRSPRRSNQRPGRSGRHGILRAMSTAAGS